MATAPNFTFADWPTRDQQAWQAATSTVVRLLDQGPCAHWKPETHRQAYYAYGRWLAFLRRHHPEALRQMAHRRLTNARVERFVARLAKRVTAQTVASSLGHLINALKAVAPTYNRAPLCQLKQRYQRLARPRDKQARMVPAEELYALGLQLMDSAQTIADAHEAARAFRDGLMIAVLICKPLRRKNLTELEINRHLQRIGAQYRLVIAADETKTGEAIDHPLPPRLTPYIEAYCVDYRLRFPGAERHHAMWPSMKGGALRPEAVYAVVCRGTKAQFGFAINPHLFRDIVVTTLSSGASGDPDAAQHALDHGNWSMTDKHYRRSNCLEASRQHARLLEALAAAPAPDAEART